MSNKFIKIVDNSIKTILVIVFICFSGLLFWSAFDKILPAIAIRNWSRILEYSIIILLDLLGAFISISYAFIVLFIIKER